ncbi:MAG: HDIG domain-containing metalloprotein, partial [Calditrichota bacterium]
KKDELIIDRNIVVKPEHIAKLRSLAIKRAELELDQGGLRAWLPAIGYFILIGLIIGFFGAFIALMRMEVWNDWKLLLLITLVLSSLHGCQVLTPVDENMLRYLFPAALAAMLLGILVDRGVAMAAIGVFGLIGGLLRGSDFPTVLIAVCGGSAAILAIRNVRARGDVMRATLYLLPVYIPIALAFRIIQFNLDRQLWGDLALAGANSVLSPILALGLVFIFEKLFRITTDLSLLELVDLNQPLLRDLAIKSPGTYHHSIMVGSLAEAAARAIGANALLTRAGAYYHDIGKMINREYFIENQETGSENIHDKLPPSKSAQIVINHVQQGLLLADQHRLPPKVKAFIAEHHGRSKLAYFYAKARKELGDDVSEERFSYPGPNPQSKETGILMLADVVEAATRSNEHPSTDDIRTIVEKLIHQRIDEGDLDECPLTLREINQIQETFIQVLGGIHHQRIPYPEQASETNTSSDDSASSIKSGINGSAS